MRLEHIGFNVTDPATVAAWYVKALDMSILRKGGPPLNAHFMLDSTGRSVVEFYSKPDIAVSDYTALDPWIHHIAFHTEDIAAIHTRLLEAGATAVGDIQVLGEDRMAFLRDPWGMALQFTMVSLGTNAKVGRVISWTVMT